MRHVYRTALKAAFLAGLAAGCSVAPAVQYEEVVKPDTQGLPKFKLQSSIIAIEQVAAFAMKISGDTRSLVNIGRSRKREGNQDSTSR
ncbi:MAG: hypothetical protein M5U33_06095 [Pseudorhodoplanes sp.]|nr:hypothetical protein [Pseudorhodoplanes sp.]